MSINPEAVGTGAKGLISSWNTKDSLLYALGVGCGTDDLAFTTENSQNIDQQAFPTQVVVIPEIAPALGALGTFNPIMLVHGGQKIRLFDDLPVAGSVTTDALISAIWDKGSNAVVEITATSRREGSTEPLFENTMTLVLRGEGGFGGSRGPVVEKFVPEHKPDREMVLTTREDQALLYRLSGDRNPLHSDPTFAAMAGFPRPILHGLCTYGVTGRALLALCCEGDVSRFGSMEGRFSSPVFPGEALKVSVWDNPDGSYHFVTSTESAGVVFDAGVFTCRT